MSEPKELSDELQAIRNHIASAIGLTDRWHLTHLDASTKHVGALLMHLARSNDLVGYLDTTPAAAATTSTDDAGSSENDDRTTYPFSVDYTYTIRNGNARTATVHTNAYDETCAVNWGRAQLSRLLLDLGLIDDDRELTVVTATPTALPSPEGDKRIMRDTSLPLTQRRAAFRRHNVRSLGVAPE